MATSDADESTGARPESDGQVSGNISTIDKVQIFIGGVFLVVSCGIMGYLCYSVVISRNFMPPNIDQDSSGSASLAAMLYSNPHIATGLVLALLSGAIGLRIFGRINSNNSQVIRREDRKLLEPLINEANRDSIDQYIRLSSLSGWIGAFTKIGFTGLPLATVILTLIFVGCALLTRDADGAGATASTLFDMAKLTLGAFIGSFVQKQVEQRQSTAPDGSTRMISEPRLPV